MSLRNLYLRKQIPYLSKEGHMVRPTEYCDEVVYSMRKSGTIVFYLLALSVGAEGHFVDLESFENLAGINKLELTKEEIENEFYSAEEFKKNAKPIMKDAELLESTELKSYLNGMYRSKRFKFAKLYPEHNIYTLIATDGQHMLVKKGNRYTFLPYPYCDKKSWKVAKTDVKSAKDASAEIDKAFNSYKKEFKTRYSLSTQSIERTQGKPDSKDKGKG